MQQAGALLAVLGLRCATSGSDIAPMPTPRARALLARFGLRYPIFSAGMGALGTPELAAAVSNGGGLGAIGTGANPAADLIRDRVVRTRAATDRPFAVNYLLTWSPDTLPIALDAGAPVIQFAWGLPAREHVAAIGRAGARMGVQVSSADGARQAVDLGADYLICQGSEAGGHVQATRGLYEVLHAVIGEAGEVPVLAAGGITSGGHIRRALSAGASGVLMGTRFIATREAACHDEYKSALVRASAPEETVLTVCFQDGWVNAPHRVLRNRTLERWEAAGCPPPGGRPGEGDVVAISNTGVERRRYSTTSPRPGDQGALLDLALYAGTGVSEIHDIPPAGELVARLWDECLRNV